MALTGYDYFKDRSEGVGGLSALLPLIEAERRTHKNVLLLDNGDTLQGTPLADTAHSDNTLWPDGTHPMVAALGALGLDCGTLGNHEFNFGVEGLRRMTETRAYPIVCANVRKADGAALFPPWVLLERVFEDTQGQAHPLKIGVFGVCPPQILTWDRRLLEGKVVVEDMVAAARQAADALRQQGADLVIALAHTGLEEGGYVERQENAAREIARVVRPDAMVAGHTHTRFPTEPDTWVEGVPLVQPGFWGSDLGVIDLTLTSQGEGWSVTDRSAHLSPAVRDACPDARITALVEKVHQRCLAQIRKPVGTSSELLHSYFAQAAPSAAVGHMLAAQTAWAAEVLGPECDRPILAAAGPFKAGGRAGAGHYVDIQAGPILQSHVADLYFYPNALTILEVTGRDVRLWLERAAAQFCAPRIDGPAGPLIDQRAAAYDFDVVGGVQYRFDLSQPAGFTATGAPVGEGRRVVDLSYGGRAVRDADRFYLVTTDYRAGGGGGYPVGHLEHPVAAPPTPSRAAFADYVARGGLQTPLAEASPWGFAPLPGASALFKTGPAAAGVDPPAHFTLLGPTEDGFDAYRVTFPPA